MKIRFVGTRPREVVSAGRSFVVQPGAEYEVPDRLGASLCQQKWFEPGEDQAEPEPVGEPARTTTRTSRKESTK